MCWAWKKQIREPQGFMKPPKNQSVKPYISAEIDWVHGYRGSKCSNNIHYLEDGSLAYHTAALGVITQTTMNARVRSQRVFDGHDNEITALTVSQDRKIVATGDAGGLRGENSVIKIWDSMSLQERHSI
jgi:hypothetical protein